MSSPLARPRAERNPLCAEIEPESGVECLLAANHVELRQTKHRGVWHPGPHARTGRQVMWGEGREVWKP